MHSHRSVCFMNYRIHQLRNEKRILLSEAKRLADIANVRAMTPAERTELDKVVSKLDDHEARIRAVELGADAGNDDDNQDGADQNGRSRRGDRKSAPYLPNGSFGIHTGRKHDIDIMQGIRDCLANKPVSGLLGELHQEVCHRDGRQPEGNGFFLPRAELRTDLITDTTTGAGAITQQYGDFLYYLRKASIYPQLGIKDITDVQGNLILPKETAGAVSQFVAEGSSVSPTAATISQVKAVTRSLVTNMTFSRQLLKSSSYDVQEILLTDMGRSVGEKLNDVVIAGDGTGADPTGILYSPDMLTISMAAGGAGPIAWADILELERQVMLQNPPGDTTKRYLTGPGGSKVLKSTARIGSTFPSFIWEQGRVNDYEALSSNHVPENLQISGQSGNYSQLLFGDWESAMSVVYFGSSAAQILIDPWSQAQTNQVRLFVILDCDVLVKRGNLICSVAFPVS